MSRYIDADEFEDELYEHEFSNWCDKDEVSELIDNMPFADVEPVRHSTWKEVLVGMDYEYECTRCKACVNQIYPYCPNCGAKMGEWVEVPSHWMIVGSKDGEYFEVKEQDDED